MTPGGGLPPIYRRPFFDNLELQVNVETYACDFLRSRGYRGGRDYDTDSCVSKAAQVFVEEQGVQITLANLRGMAAMAQFSAREMRPDVLELIAKTGFLSGDTWVSMDSTSVKLLTVDRHASVIEGMDVL